MSERSPWVVGRFLSWLQKDNPTGGVERFPTTDERHHSSLPGVFVAGDLTGVPLLKLAAESGARLVRDFDADESFRKAREEAPADVVEVVIVGAGPAGVAAAMECQNLGLRYQLLEATRRLNTIQGFPKGKPILIRPTEETGSSRLALADGDKESLLDDLERQIAASGIEIREGVMVKRLRREGGYVVVETSDGTLRALRVVLAIGKSGNPRRLNVPGEDLAKVFDKLYDPADFAGQRTLVVGGGDSALEATIALARAGAEVTHSYRRATLARPKEENVRAFEELVAGGRITPLLESTVGEIRKSSVVLKTPEGDREIPNDAVLTLIGRELPVDFFQRSGIRMEGEKGPSYWLYLVAMVSFFTMLYFGKKGNAYDVVSQADGVWEGIQAYLLAPWRIAREGGFLPESYGLTGYQRWLNPLNFLIGWAGSLVFLASGAIVVGNLLRQPRRYFGSPWPAIKYAYLTLAALAFFWVYVDSTFGNAASWVNGPTQWYSLLYCTTMALFAVRRAWVRRTRYVCYQMATLVTIQVVFLYLLPFQRIGDDYLFDLLIGNHFDPNGWFMQEVFPSGRWTSFWFILFWPLSIDAFGQTTFWTWFPVVQLAVLFFLIYHYGKGVYCGWICSCGGMAESFGDEYRTLAPHGPAAKRWENVGQAVLAAAIVATAVHYLGKKGILPGPGSLLGETIWGLYLVLVDVVFAGVLGLGVYFFLSGRIWCRYGCPLAAIMHVMARFSRYRIVSEKKKCISCNVCTKVCHMGIDVMSYAHRGIPMNDVQCVRCSACVISCPMDVLAFAKLPRADLDNRSRFEMPAYGKDDWRAGLR